MTKKTDKKQVVNGKIVTFYSYKGGVGRSMALANMACLLAKEGKKVLMIDWDIEAPGLHEYFKPHINNQTIFANLAKLSEDEKAFFKSEDKLDVKGIGKLDIHDYNDYVNEINKKLNTQSFSEALFDFETFINEKDGLLEYFLKTDENIKTPIDEEDITKKQLESLESAITNIQNYITQFEIEEQNISLSFLKAGRYDEGYSDRIDTMNWPEFYKKVPIFFTKLAYYLKSQYDYILIDSRTGHTDTGGICTMIMPEKLILVYTPNRQSLNGVLKLAEKAADYRKNSADLRPLTIYPLPSRVELAEDSLKNQWKSEYNQKFTKLYKKIYNLPDNISLDDYFDSVQLRHVPKYAYGEEIAVLVENGKIDTITLGYKNLLEYFDKEILDEKNEKIQDFSKTSSIMNNNNISILFSMSKEAIKENKTRDLEVELYELKNIMRINHFYDLDDSNFEDDYVELVARSNIIIYYVDYIKYRSEFFRKFELINNANLLNANKKIVIIYEVDKKISLSNLHSLSENHSAIFTSDQFQLVVNWIKEQMIINKIPSLFEKMKNKLNHAK